MWYLNVFAWIFVLNLVVSGILLGSGWRGTVRHFTLKKERGFSESMVILIGLSSVVALLWPVSALIAIGYAVGKIGSDFLKSAKGLRDTDG